MTPDGEVKALRAAFDRVKRAAREIDDGRVMKQEIYVASGIENLRRALRDLEAVIRKFE